MKAALRLGTLLFLLFVMVTIFAPTPAEAQNDYPLPQGNPSDWNIPGTPDKLVPEKRQTSTPDMFSAPAPRGNEALNQPSVPAGEAQEKYTGTRDRGFGGVAGTGIDQPGAGQNP
jgi:hypothetical protein